jgi:hypothetical protein
VTNIFKLGGGGGEGRDSLGPMLFFFSFQFFDVVEVVFERQLKEKFRCSFDFIFSYITILLLVFFGKNAD